MLLVSLVACSDYALDKHLNDPGLGEPDILVEPAEITWPTLGVGCVDEQEVTITNQGSSPLTLDGTWVEGDPSLTSSFLTDTLSPGDSVTMSVRFQPESVGEVLADVIVSSDDPDEPEVTVPNLGHVSAQALSDDAFVQEADPVDVLWVIDNSSSMATEQARVAAGINSFFSWFTTLNLDYHMGVITTDIVNPIYSGRLVGSPTYIDSSTVDPAAALVTAINVGENDMGNESGLRAAELALSEPLVSTDNAGFLRPDARLVMIFLSDEPEQSDYDADHYIQFFDTLKADPGNVMASAIVGDESAGCATTCDDVPQDAQPGDKYLAVVSEFSGIFGSICTCDLTPSLDEIGMAATHYVRSFILSDTPSDPAQIVVYVDGEESTDWSYLAITNEIVFGTPPINGSEVVVRYPTSTACE
jgi:hypothetical protein